MEKPIIGTKAGQVLIQDIREGARTDRIVLKGKMEKNLREGIEEVSLGYVCNLCLRLITEGEVLRVERESKNIKNLRGENASRGAYSYVCVECEDKDLRKY